MKLKIKENHPIFNTFHIEARAARYAEYASAEELQSLIPELAHQTVLHVGGGSNLLFLKDFGIGNAWRIFHIIGFYRERKSTDLVRQLGTNRRATACRLLANSEPARSWQAVDELPKRP